MRCKKCPKVVHAPTALSWAKWQICPQCLDTKTNKNLAYEDNTIFRIEVNPVDLYWAEMARKYLNL